MSCFGLKGGIGTASRRVRTSSRGRFTIGTLVLANFGKASQIRVLGRPLAPVLKDPPGITEPPEKGSIILLIATDAPLDARQLRRLALRAGAGLARTGSVFGHGSGDIALAFSTAYTLPAETSRPMPSPCLLHDAELDPLFEGVADGIEQAIIHALWRAETVTAATAIPDKQSPNDGPTGLASSIGETPGIPSRSQEATALPAKIAMLLVRCRPPWLSLKREGKRSFRTDFGRSIRAMPSLDGQSSAIRLRYPT